MRKDDRVRLQHMHEAAGEALSFAAGRSRADLNRDRQLVLSLVKDIEIAGEAAARVSAEARAALPAIPWADIVGMRNRLIHGYYTVDLDRVWSTVSDDLPPLVRELARALGTEP